MTNIQVSGIVRIPAYSIHHLSSHITEEVEKLSAELRLTPLPAEKRHTTLLHQNTSGLKQLCKLVKKYEKGKLDSNPVVYPSVDLPEISTDGAQVVVVEDVHPTSGVERKTVRIILREELQQALASWVASFCELNGLERDELELKRIFHISYSNLTGLPGDSVR